MTSISGFGKGNRDLRIAGLKCNDFGGNVQVCGAVVAPGFKVILDHDILIEGYTFSASDEFTSLFSFQKEEGNVCIEPQTGLHLRIWSSRHVWASWMRSSLTAPSCIDRGKQKMKTPSR
jgi:hypothetical protein